MNKQEILAKVKELAEAPTVCAPLKSAAEAYLANQNKANAEALIKALEENVNSIDDTIKFASSDRGKDTFGAENAAGMVKSLTEAKIKGEKYCLCPACQAGAVVYANREAL